MVKSLCRKITASVVTDNVKVNTRHVDDLKFVHVTARTDRLHHNPIHAFPRLWEEMPVTFRSDLVVHSLETFVKNLKRQVCC